MSAVINEKEEMAGEALDRYEYILEKDYEVDVSELIKESKSLKQGFDGDFIETWYRLDQSVVSSVYRDHIDSVFGHIATEMAGRARRYIHSDTKLDKKYLEWCCVAAAYKNATGAKMLLNYAVGHELKEPIVKFWLAEALRLLEVPPGSFLTHEGKELRISDSLQVISKVALRHPKLVVKYVFKLLGDSKKIRNGEKTHEAVKIFADELTSKIAGVRVLDSIQESSDRVTRDTCERYQNLTTELSSLAKINDVLFLSKTLSEEFPWCRDIIKKITDGLLVRQLGVGTFYLPPMLILGEPGLGKTTFVKRLAELSNVPHQTLSFAGQSDNRYLQGTARGWSSGQPSMPLSLINDHSIANPIVIIDELDKAGGSAHNGAPLDTLLTLFEPSSAKKVFDEFLLGHADLSHITWVCTGNDVSQMPNTLLSRLEVVTIQKPKKEHYPAIIKRTINDFYERNGIDLEQIPHLDEADWQWLGKYYTTPRKARQATEKWLTYKLLNPQKMAIN